MSNLKIIEVIVAAGAAIFSAAKYVIKFIDCIFKLSNRNAVASTA